MSFASIRTIRETGYQGFISIEDLRKSKCSEVPRTAGIYLVVRPKRARPSFSRAARYGKGRYRPLRLAELKERWVATSVVVYIGQASTNLKHRINSYVRFGQNKNSGHSGGRCIWHLRDSAQLIICWKTIVGDTEALEKKLIREFKATNKSYPFANRRG